MSSTEVNPRSQPTEVNPRQLPTQQTEVNMQQYEHATTTQYRYFIIDGRIVSAIVGLFIVGLLKKFLFD